MEEVAGIRRIVIHGHDAVPALARGDHLRFVGMAVPRGPFFQGRRVDELRFGEVQLVADFK